MTPASRCQVLGKSGVVFSNICLVSLPICDPPSVSHVAWATWIVQLKNYYFIYLFKYWCGVSVSYVTRKSPEDILNVMTLSFIYSFVHHRPVYPTRGRGGTGAYPSWQWAKAGCNGNIDFHYYSLHHPSTCDPSPLHRGFIKYIHFCYLNWVFPFYHQPHTLTFQRGHIIAFHSSFICSLFGSDCCYFPSDQFPSDQYRLTYCTLVAWKKPISNILLVPFLYNSYTSELQSHLASIFLNGVHLLIVSLLHS